MWHGIEYSLKRPASNFAGCLTKFSSVTMGMSVTQVENVSFWGDSHQINQVGWQQVRLDQSELEKPWSQSTALAVCYVST